MTLAEANPQSPPRARKKPAAKPVRAKPRKVSRSKKAPPVGKAIAKPVAKPASAVETWTAQFVYADADGSARVSLMTIEAKSLDAARDYAAAHAPAGEFMLSLHPRSDEQFLGQVRHRALAAAKRS